MEQNGPILMYILVSFDNFEQLCGHHHNQDIKLFCLPKTCAPSYAILGLPLPSIPPPLTYNPFTPDSHLPVFCYLRLN